VSQVNPYASIQKRSFESALVHLLETEYGLIGGRRILQLLAEDVVKLVAEFYPPTQQASSGSLIWTCTADVGQKAEPGKRTEAYKSVTVRLPLVTNEDLADRTDKKVPHSQRQASARARDIQRLVRLVKSAHEQGGLLTLAELSVLLNRSYEVVRGYVEVWQAESGELLPLKGYQMDQGCRPTHKGEIIRLFEQGLEAPDIARETAHNLKSVERYLKDYERVKLLLKRGLTAEEISSMIGRGRTVVLEYIQIAREYHPDLFASPASSPD
jgi:hypothetical protein